VNNHCRAGALALALVLPALPAFAQTAASPSPEALKLAEQLVAKVGGERAATLQAISGPMVGMMQQMGIQQPDRAQALVQEAVMPVLSAHYNDLVQIEAKSYASVLSVTDLKAIVAFYDTPAGQSLIRAQPQLAQAKVTGMTQWMGTMQPELQAKIQQTLKTHGWDKG